MKKNAKKKREMRRGGRRRGGGVEMENFMKSYRVKILLKYFTETLRETFINFILSKN